MKPPRSDKYPDRHLECQEALEPMVTRMVEAGTASGWTIAEITTALIDLADHQMLIDAANRQVDRDIREMLRKMGL